MENVNQLITNYNGNNGFMLSLQRQLTYKGALSEKQVVAAQKFFSLVPVEQTPQVFTYKKGDQITIRTWFARTCKQKFNMPFFFRNLIIEEVLAETSKAIQVKVSFHSKVANCCHLCGKGLDTEISRATGIGPVCGKKYFKLNKMTLENAQEVLNKIEQEAKNAGVFGAMWIPKSQIMHEAEVILFEKE